MLLIGTTLGLQDLDTGDTLISGHAVTALAPGPTGWHALLDRRLVVRVDVGSTASVGELPEPDGQSLAVLPDGTVVVGRTGARLARLNRDGQVLDVPVFEALPERDSWENPANPTPDTRSMAADARRWWVNVHVGGLWWSDDTGASWHAAVEPEADIHEVRTDARCDGHVAVAAAVGFGWTTDAGASWSWTIDGLSASYLRAAALDGETAFVSASDGPFTKGGAVYRARLGSSFGRCDTGLPASFPGNVDSGHLDASTGRAAFGFAETIYRSDDAGQTWRVGAALAGPVTAVRFGAA